MLKLLIAGGGGQEEYFLIENRQLEGYDRSLPLCYNGYYDEEADDFIWSWLGGGLLVYHIYPNRYTPTMVNLVGHYNWEAPYFATDRRFTRLNDAIYPYTRLSNGHCAWFDMLPESPSGTEMRLSITPLSRFTITYIDDFYWRDAPEPQTKAKGETITLSAYAPEIDGWRFYGWGTDPEAKYASYQPGSTYSGDSGLVLYAIWKVKLTWYQYILYYLLFGWTGIWRWTGLL